MEKLRILISRHEIQEKVARIAEEVSKDYRDKNPILVGVLKGSFVFLADLIRALDIPLEVEFVHLSSYGRGKETSGRVKVVQGLRTPMRGRDVLVVEDIVDSGLTTGFLLDSLSKKKPASIRLCALLDKPSRRKVPVPIDYLGLTIPDVFVVGYGLDCDERFRYLPDICAVEEG